MTVRSNRATTDGTGMRSITEAPNAYVSRCRAASRLTPDRVVTEKSVENALRGSAVLTRVKERHWTQLY